MIGQIFIIGIIGDETGLPGPSVNLLDVVTQLHQNKEATGLTVIISSIGGRCDLGYEIHALLKSQNKPITTIIKGVCASIATVIAMAGDIRLIEEGSEFMIHNPWAGAEGDADHLEQAAIDIRAQEDKMISFYNKSTGIDKNSLDALMKQETFLSAEKAVELGFLTGVILKQKAVALLNKESNMSNSLKDIRESIKAMGAEILAVLKPAPIVAKALSITGGDGVIYTITPGDGVEDGLVEVGDLFSLPDGSLGTGDFIMPDGSTLKVEAGKIVEVLPAATAVVEEPKAEEPNALQLENEELKNKITALLKDHEDSKAVMNEIQEEHVQILAALKRTGSSYKPPVANAAFAKNDNIIPEKISPFKAANEERKNSIKK